MKPSTETTACMTTVAMPELTNELAGSHRGRQRWARHPAGGDEFGSRGRSAPKQPASGGGKGGSMRKLVAYMLVSVDGVAEDPNTFLLEWDQVLQANLGEVIGTQDT